MKLLIVGGCGYIGSILVKNLKQKFDITILDINSYEHEIFYGIETIICDIKNYKEFKQYDVVIIVSGNSSVKSSSNLFSTMENNVNNFMHVIKNTNKKQKIIYASSSSVYGNTLEDNVDEEFEDIKSYNYYDLSKKIIDSQVKILLKNEQRCIFGLRFGTVNGFSPKFRNDIMINSMINNGIIHGKINVFNIETKRPILGINDLSRAVEKIILEGDTKNSGIYNLASFNSTVKEIVIEIKNKTGFDYQILDTPDKITNTKLQTSNYNFNINTDKFEKIFSFKFEETIASICQDIIKNYKNIIINNGRINDIYLNHIEKCKTINKCRVCENEVEELFDIGQQPLANEFHNNKYLLNKYPLKLMLCNNCFHLQLSNIINPYLLYNNYIYLSGTSNTLSNYFENLANFIISSIKKDGTIVEIACNDGSQLDYFADKNWKTIGIDPAKNLYIYSSKKNKIYPDFFKKEIALEINKNHTIDVILAQNVFAHTDDINSFIINCKIMMNTNTILYIQVSQANLIRNNEFDTIYHEHLSFFNINSMKTLIEKHGLFINKITKPEIHGVSYLFEISKVNKESNLDSMLEEERKLGLMNITTYKDYVINCKLKSLKFKQKIYQYIEKGYIIIGYGASAKGNTLMNYLNLSSEEISFIVDDNVKKQNLYTPGSNIIIKNKENIINIDKLAVIMITWNFSKEIKDKINKIRKEKITEYIYY